LSSLDIGCWKFERFRWRFDWNCDDWDM